MSNGNPLMALGIAQALTDEKRILIARNRPEEDKSGLYWEILDILSKEPDSWGVTVTRSHQEYNITVSGRGAIDFCSPYSIITRGTALRGRVYDFVVCHNISPEEERRVRAEMAPYLLSGEPGLVVRG